MIRVCLAITLLAIAAISATLPAQDKPEPAKPDSQLPSSVAADGTLPASKTTNRWAGFSSFGDRAPVLIVTELETILRESLNAIGAKHHTASKNLLLAMSEKGDRLFGYSRPLEKWTTLKLDKPFQGLRPEKNDDVGFVNDTVQKGDAFESGRHIWAYSSKNGTWDYLELPADSKAYPVLAGDRVILLNSDGSDGGVGVVFSNRTGKWAKPTDGLEELAQLPETPADTKKLLMPPAQGNPQPETSTLKIFHLQHSSATDIATILQQLFRDERVKIAADTRTNSVIVSGPENLQSAIAALAKKLDEEPAKAVQKAPAIPSRPALQAADNSPSNAKQLKEEYEAEERQAAAIAQQIRAAPAIDPALKSKLEQAVATAFSLRQKLHKAEVAAFQQRMADVQQKILVRERIKDQVIDHRVRELLNPNLRWKPSGSSSQVTNEAAVAAQMTNANELVGTWQWISSADEPEVSKRLVTGVFTSNAFFRFEDDHWSRFDVVLSSNLNPKTIELKDNNTSEITKGIYRLADDKLTIAWEDPMGFTRRDFEPDSGALDVEVWKRIQPTELVQLRFTAPVNAVISPADADIISSNLRDQQRLPVTRTFATGETYELKLSSIRDFPGLELPLSIELPVTPGTHNVDAPGPLSLGVEFIASDLQHIRSAGSLTRAIYLTNPESKRARREVLWLSSNELGPNKDVVAEADRRGTVLAIIRISTPPPVAERLHPVAVDSTPTELEGDWRLESTATSGMTSYNKEMNLWVRNHNWITLSNDSDERVSFVTNSASTPKTIDVILDSKSNPISIKGIYRLEGDTFVIARQDDGERPQEFGGAKVYINTWKRNRSKQGIVSLQFNSLKGSQVSWSFRDKRSASGLPRNFAFSTGASQPLQVRRIPYHPELQLSVVLHPLAESDSAREGLLLNPISLELNDNDLELLEAGKRLAKAYVVPTATAEKAAPSDVEVISSDAVDPQADVMKEGRKQGTVLAVVMVSKIENQSAPVPILPVNPEPAAPKSNARLILKDAQEFQKQFQDLARQLQKSQSALEAARETLKADKGTQRLFDIKQKNYDDHTQQLKLLRAEYDSQLKLLDAEVRSLQKALELAQAEWERGTQLLPTKAVTKLEVQRLEFAKDEAAARLEQTRTLLELYRTITHLNDAAKSIDPQTSDSILESPKSK